MVFIAWVKPGTAAGVDPGTAACVDTGTVAGVVPGPAVGVKPGPADFVAVSMCRSSAAAVLRPVAELGAVLRRRSSGDVSSEVLRSSLARSVDVEDGRDAVFAAFALPPLPAIETPVIRNPKLPG